MNTHTLFCSAVAALAVAASSEAGLDIVLEVDLSVENQVTISATNGLSAATVSGSDTTGFYLQDIFGAGGSSGSLGDTLVTGNLTSFLNTSDGSPDLYNSIGDAGLNVWTYTNDPESDFVAGTQAFSGLATWNISPATYADLLDGPTSGNVWAIADTFDDIPPGGGNASLIGEYFVIPAPGALAMLAIAGVAGTRRRRG